MFFIEHFQTALFYNPFETLYSDLCVFYFHELFNNRFMFTRHFQDAFVYRAGQDVIVWQHTGPFFTTNLLMAAKRHIPWRKSEKYLASGF